MLTTLLATDDSSSQPTRHLCSFPPPLRLKILNIMGNFWLVIGNWHTEELNFTTILFSFFFLLHFHPSATPHLFLAPPVVMWTHHSIGQRISLLLLLLFNFHLQELSVNNQRWSRWKWGCWFERITLVPIRSNSSVFHPFRAVANIFRNTEVVSLQSQCKCPPFSTFSEQT